jgi:hypothetical protein
MLIAAAVLFIFTAADEYRALLGQKAGLADKLLSFSAVKSIPHRTSFVTLTGKSDDRLSGVVNALQAGNAEELSKYFDNYVDLTLPDRRVSSYSKSQAKMVLKDFFDNIRVKGFNWQIKGDGETSNYCIGTLQTLSGNFRATMYIRQEGEQPLIKEFNLAGLR